jgi:Ni2+-binding GTPase involved in maturation of urease and hydrogenase
MKLVLCAGPATAGKTAVLRCLAKKLLAIGDKVAFLKLDVQIAEEDEAFHREIGLPDPRGYSGERCSNHCSVPALGEALAWATKAEANVLLVETAGLCLRCSSYLDHGLGMVFVDATSGMDLPLKIGPTLSLADVAVVTKVDRVSAAEHAVFRARIKEVAPKVLIREVDTLHGIGIDSLACRVTATPEAVLPMQLLGNQPAGTCGNCSGKKEIGWHGHFGVVRPLDERAFRV